MITRAVTRPVTRPVTRGPLDGRGTLTETIGGITIGATGEAGTIYEGFRLAGGDDFTSLSLLTQAKPSGRYIPSHRRRGRRAINAASNDAYFDATFTGHNDANRGAAIGGGVSDLLSASGGVVSLSTRLASAEEKSLAWDTTASTGPDRQQSSAAFHSAGYQAVKWPCIIEARIKPPTGAQLPPGGWPAFWCENVLPTWANTGEWDFEWIDDGTLYPNFVVGDSSGDLSIGLTAIDTADGDYHVFSMVATATSLKFYIDGALKATSARAPHDHVPGPMFWWLRIGVDLTPGIYRMTYDAAAWVGVTSTMDVDYVRIWTQPTATDLGYKGVAATVNVDFDGAIATTLPSKTSLWGSDTVIEYLIFQPIDNAEPGIAQIPTTGGTNEWYGQTADVNGLWGPTFLSWNPTTRAFTGSGFDAAGRMVAHLVAWDDTNGGLAGFSRVVVNVGPKVNATNLAYTEGATVSLDLYPMCDCGMLTTDASGAKAKTISVSGLSGSGLSYDDATGLLTGTAALGSYSLTVTCTNSVGQSASKSITLTISEAVTAPAYESWDGPGWFDASATDTVSTSGSTVTGVANKRTSGGDLVAGGTSGKITLVSSAQNGMSAIRVVRDVSNLGAVIPRLYASTSSVSISTMFQGDDKPYTVITAYKPTDENTGFIWSASDRVGETDHQCIGLVRRAASASSVRRNLVSTTNDVSWGAGQASGSPRIVAIKHSGTEVTVWDTSITKSVDATAQNTSAFNTALVFRLFCTETAGLTDPKFLSVQCNLDFYEILMEDEAKADADIVQAIQDIAAKWGITLS